MKKIISILIHIIFLIPLLIIAMGLVELIASKFGLLPDYIRVFEMPYILLMIGIIVIFGIPVFWLANRLMYAIEKVQIPTIYDHLRQSVFFYIIIIYSLFTWISNGFQGSVSDLYFLILSGFSMISILVNYIFLFRRRNVIGTQ